MAFTLGLAQVRHPEDGDAAGLVERWCSEAEARGVDLLVFPESLMCPYERELGEFLRAAEPLGGAFATSVRDSARRHGLWVVFTMNERSDDPARPHNTAVVCDDSGEVRGVYRKCHLFDTSFTQESSRMMPGDELLEPVDTPFGRIGLGICYDLRFPEVARHAATRGADVLLYPAAWVDGPLKADHWKGLLAARAIENEVFVAGVSRCDRGYVGQSRVVDPLGVTRAAAGTGEELVACRVETGEIAVARANMPILEHRRPELYG